jgi:hypothetical protein
MSGFFPVGGFGSSSGSSPITQAVLSAPAAAINTPVIPTAGLQSILIVYGFILSNAAGSSDGMQIRFNSDSGVHYGDSLNGFNAQITRSIPAASINGNRAGGQIFVPNYQSLTSDITLLGQHAARTSLGGVASDFSSGIYWNGLWNNGAVIQTVNLTLTSAGNFATGGYIKVYGYS